MSRKPDERNAGPIYAPITSSGGIPNEAFMENTRKLRHAGPTRRSRRLEIHEPRNEWFDVERGPLDIFRCNLGQFGAEHP